MKEKQLSKKECAEQLKGILQAHCLWPELTEQSFQPQDVTFGDPIEGAIHISQPWLTEDALLSITEDFERAGITDAMIRQFHFGHMQKKNRGGILIAQDIENAINPRASYPARGETGIKGR